MTKSFLDLSDFSKKELRTILNVSKKIKLNPNKYSASLKSKTLGMIFEKKSMRTRLSFNIGMLKLGGNVIELDTKQIGYGSRESIYDTLRVMSQYLDCLMIRNDNHQELIELSKMNILPIINGLSNFSHPCQILSDIFTIEEHMGSIEKKVVVWIGDFNNVLVSLMHAAEIFRFRLNIMVPNQIIKNKKKTMNIGKLKHCFFYDNINNSVKNADVIMTDVWLSMGETDHKKKNLFVNFQINDEVMKKANKNSIFMHCLPANRNEEVTDSVIDGKSSVVLKQAQNRMYVQQAILNFLIGNE